MSIQVNSKQMKTTNAARNITSAIPLQKIDLEIGEYLRRSISSKKEDLNLEEKEGISPAGEDISGDEINGLNSIIKSYESSQIEAERNRAVNIDEALGNALSKSLSQTVKAPTKEEGKVTLSLDPKGPIIKKQFVLDNPLLKTLINKAEDFKKTKQIDK